MNSTDTFLAFVLIVNLALSAVVAWVASERGRGPWAWFFLSLLLSPVLAVIILLVVPAGPGGGRRYYDDGPSEPSKLTEADHEVIRLHRARQKAEDWERRFGKRSV